AIEARLDCCWPCMPKLGRVVNNLGELLAQTQLGSCPGDSDHSTLSVKAAFGKQGQEGAYQNRWGGSPSPHLTLCHSMLWGSTSIAIRIPTGKRAKSRLNSLTNLCKL